MAASAESLLRYRDSRRAVYVSMAVNFSLALAQIAIGFIGHSQALMADGLHTLSDLFSDVLVWVAAKQGARDADSNHPYGHARIETAMTVALSLILIIVGLGIAVRAGVRLSAHAPLMTPSVLTLVVALLTLVAKEALYRYTLRVAQRLRSNLLRASAWHHRSDAFSSILVACGIAGSLLGFEYLDAVAAIGVALLIVKMGGSLGWNALRELVDTGLDDTTLERIRKVILNINGVRTLHLLRTRQTGGQALIDVHILVDGTISVSEGHQISERVRHELMRNIDGIADVMVHIDPEDDEDGAPSATLPLRDVILARLRERFGGIGEAAAIENIGLHYLQGKIRVELTLPLAVLKNLDAAADLRARFRAAVSDETQIGQVDLRFR